MKFKDLAVGGEFICPDDAEQPRLMKIEMCDRSKDAKATYCNTVGLSEPVKGQLTWIDDDDEVEKVE